MSKNLPHQFRTSFGQSIFQGKYAHEGCETWPLLADTLVTEVVSDPDANIINGLKRLITNMGFLPGGRYLYYAGRTMKFYNNCYLLRAEEDSREEWGQLAHRATSCLMTGGGIGVDYSILREKGALLKRTGGKASGPLSLIGMINEIGRRVMQGGSRRSAIYASLNWQHPDAYGPDRPVGDTFITAKDWYNMPVGKTGMSIGQIKEDDFNFHAPLDMTNISLNYDDAFLETIYGIKLTDVIKNNNAKDLHTLFNIFGINGLPTTFIENCRQALKTGEPGFSFNFLNKSRETLRNACCEVCSEDDSDVCNLGSLNMAMFDNLEQWEEAIRLATIFLVWGTLKADLPYEKVKEVRVKNRRLGLGLMGVHEWLMKRGYRYEVVSELHDWLEVYERVSNEVAAKYCDQLGISRPVAVRAIAPTGTIGILAGTTTGIEPLFAVAFKRRYLKNGTSWRYQYVVDGTAQSMIQNYNLKPDDIETALDLAHDPERRIKFQYDIQKYVDQAISSTINLPAWGTEANNEDKVEDFAYILAKYAHGLRGFTCYPDGARGGQPLTPVSYYDAIKFSGEEFTEEAFDVCDITKGGHCGS